MVDVEQQPGEESRDPVGAYEAPVVEDLDTTEGPAVTAAAKSMPV